MAATCGNFLPAYPGAQRSLNTGVQFKFFTDLGPDRYSPCRRDPDNQFTFFTLARAGAEIIIVVSADNARMLRRFNLHISQPW